MEEKDFYTQTEVATFLGKSLSNLAFYKNELREKGYMVQEGNKEVITKEGLNYLKLRFSENYKTPKTPTEKEEGSQKTNKNAEQIIQLLQDQLKTTQEEKEHFKKEVAKWQTQCELWQNQLVENDQDKQFWREFAIKQNNLINKNLLPDKSEEEKDSKFLFWKRKKKRR